MAAEDERVASQFVETKVGDGVNKGVDMRAQCMF